MVGAKDGGSKSGVSEAIAVLAVLAVYKRETSVFGDMEVRP
jgi:hypothetical protein